MGRAKFLVEALGRNYSLDFFRFQRISEFPGLCFFLHFKVYNSKFCFCSDISPNSSVFLFNLTRTLFVPLRLSSMCLSLPHNLATSSKSLCYIMYHIHRFQGNVFEAPLLCLPYPPRDLGQLNLGKITCTLNRNNRVQFSDISPEISEN